MKTDQGGGMNYRHMSAVARCHGRGRVLEVDYSGVISQGNFHQLDWDSAPRRGRASVAFERMDHAVTVVGEVVVPEGLWLPGTPPSVVLVRPDQYEKSVEFCRALARRGIIRLTYLTSEVDQAMAFSDSVLAHS